MNFQVIGSSASLQEIVTLGSKYNIPRDPSSTRLQAQAPNQLDPRGRKRKESARAASRCAVARMMTAYLVDHAGIGHSGGAVKAAIGFIRPTQRFSTGQ